MVPPPCQSQTPPEPKMHEGEPTNEELALEPPDGGVQACANRRGGLHGLFGWSRLLQRVWVGASFNSKPYSFDPHTRSVYQDFYVREFMTARTPSEIAWIGSCQIALQFALGLAVGAAFDAGHFHGLMIVGSFIYCLSLWILSLAKPNQYYLVFLAQGIGLGIGQGLTFLPALSVATHHFSRRRSLVFGLITSGASIGGIIFPILLNHLLFRRGFTVGVRASAGLVTFLMLVANLIMRPRYPKVRSASKPSLRSILSDPPYILFVGAGVFVMLGLFYPVFYLQLYSIKRGIPQKIAFDTISFINAGGVIGRLIPNFLAGHIGSFNVITPVTFLAASCILVMLANLNSAGIVAISLLYGGLNAAFVSMTPAVLADLSSNRSEIGLRMGLWFTITAAAALAGQPLSGMLIHNDFRWSTVSAGVCMFMGGCILILSRYHLLKKLRT